MLKVRRDKNEVNKKKNDDLTQLFWKMKKKNDEFLQFFIKTTYWRDGAGWKHMGNLWGYARK